MFLQQNAEPWSKMFNRTLPTMMGKKHIGAVVGCRLLDLIIKWGPQTQGVDIC